MSTIVRMPQLAAGGTEAAIQSWLVAVGDEIAAGQALVEIETEKAVVEHEADDAGTLAAILVVSGETAAVGAPIAVLAAPGETAESAIEAAEAETGVSRDTEPAASAPAASAPALSPEPVRPAKVVPAENAAPALESAAHLTTRLFASPLVRRLAKEHGIELAGVHGSGPNGRIVRRDIDELISGTVADAQTRQAATTAPAATATQAAAEVTGYQDVPHTGMRRAIARRLVESKTTIPHFTLTADCRVDELLDLRTRFGERTAVKPSVNDFVLKAVAAAMMDVPEANAIWTDDSIRRFRSVDLAVAVSVPEGLVTPVLHGVERMSIGEIGETVRELAARGRDGRLRQHELEGGSFSVSNLGMYGIRQFSAIINPPHSGILAVGAAERRVVAGDDAEPTAATLMTVTMSADHRVLDGALAARWVAAFVDRIQNPLSLLL